MDLQEYKQFKTKKMDMKEKELIEFMHSLWNRGLISVSPDEFDYEWVVWDYLKLRLTATKPSDINHIINNLK